ncbi:MAG: DUF4199 domain-containing protein [Chitinophagaceae bacterium]|nr:DUF4199 domain-containing protein [Chitinophagaceae bacterium]
MKSYPLSPARKGLITSAVMIAYFLALSRFFPSGHQSLKYVVFGIYGAGILWTLLSSLRHDPSPAGFGELFQRGFRCFIVVTLVMTVFHFVFIKLNSGLLDEAARIYKEELIKNKVLPQEAEAQALRFKNRYPVQLISGTIFGYLILGAAVTGVFALFLSRKK